MCRAGLSYEKPNMFSITILCESPMPSDEAALATAACVVSACCAIATGWRG